MKHLLALVFLFSAANACAQQDGFSIRPEFDLGVTPGIAEHFLQPATCLFYKSGVTVMVMPGTVGFFSGIMYATYTYTILDESIRAISNVRHKQICKYIEAPIGLHIDVNRKGGKEKVWLYGEPAVALAFLTYSHYTGARYHSNEIIDVDNSAELAKTLVRWQLGFGFGIQLTRRLDLAVGWQFSSATGKNISQNHISNSLNQSPLTVASLKLGCNIKFSNTFKGRKRMTRDHRNDHSS